jgi:hypothetical protein
MTRVCVLPTFEAFTVSYYIASMDEDQIIAQRIARQIRARESPRHKAAVSRRSSSDRSVHR